MNHTRYAKRTPSEGFQQQLPWIWPCLPSRKWEKLASDQACTLATSTWALLGKLFFYEHDESKPRYKKNKTDNKDKYFRWGCIPARQEGHLLESAKDRGALSFGETVASDHLEILQSSRDKTHHGQVSQFRKERHFPSKDVLPFLLKLAKYCKRASTSAGAGISSASAILIWRRSFPKVRAKGFSGLVFQIQKCPRQGPRAASAHD